jgi:hypothetical protein
VIAYPRQNVEQIELYGVHHYDALWGSGAVHNESQLTRPIERIVAADDAYRNGW